MKWETVNRLFAITSAIMLLTGFITLVCVGGVKQLEGTDNVINYNEVWQNYISPYYEPIPDSDNTTIWHPRGGYFDNWDAGDRFTIRDKIVGAYEYDGSHFFILSWDNGTLDMEQVDVPAPHTIVLLDSTMAAVFYLSDPYWDGALYYYIEDYLQRAVLGVTFDGHVADKFYDGQSIFLEFEVTEIIMPIYKYHLDEDRWEVIGNESKEMLKFHVDYQQNMYDKVHCWIDKTLYDNTTTCDHIGPFGKPFSDVTWNADLLDILSYAQQILALSFIIAIAIRRRKQIKEYKDIKVKKRWRPKCKNKNKREKRSKRKKLNLSSVPKRYLKSSRAKTSR